MKKHICALAVLSGLSFSAMALDCDPNLLPSWKDGASKSAIVNYVDQSTDASKKTFIAEQDRIAVFDNDGTLWSEKPFYFQLAYALDEVKLMAKDHPEWKTQEPFKSVLNDDIEGVFKGGEKALLEIVKVTHSGMTVEEYQQKVADWLKVAKDPRFTKLIPNLHTNQCAKWSPTCKSMVLRLTSYQVAVWTLCAFGRQRCTVFPKSKSLAAR